MSDVTFEVQPGEVVSLIGESGSGKTTVGRMILRLTAVTDGTITFEGQDVTTLGGRQLRGYYKHVQGVFQDPVQLVQPRVPGRPGVRDDPRELPRRPQPDRVAHEAASVTRGGGARAGRRARQVSAPAERRAAAAPADRARAAPRDPVPRRRRDHQHARRVHPDRRAQPARRPEGARSRDPVRHARPVARQLHLRPGGDPPSRDDRRDGSDGEGVRPAGAPVHEDAARLGAAAARALGR